MKKYIRCKICNELLNPRSKKVAKFLIKREGSLCYAHYECLDNEALSKLDKINIDFGGIDYVYGVRYPADDSIFNILKKS